MEKRLGRLGVMMFPSCILPLPFPFLPLPLPLPKESGHKKLEQNCIIKTHAITTRSYFPNAWIFIACMQGKLRILTSHQGRL